jgi:hypothetical protein
MVDDVIVTTVLKNDTQLEAPKSTISVCWLICERPVISLSTVVLCGADPTEKTTSPSMHQTRGVLRIVSLIRIEYRLERHLLPTVPHTGISGLSPVSVTGSPYRCTSLSSPQTSSNIRVRAGPSRPSDGSAMTMKHGSWAKDFVSGSKKRANTRIHPRAFQWKFCTPRLLPSNFGLRC